MYFSRVTLKINQLPYVLQHKMRNSGPYAIHQWLWQLFPNQEKRTFLFREERIGKGYQYYLLSEVAPLSNHQFFLIETKPYQPKLTTGMRLFFSLRANPVVFKNGKRSDVLMNAKYPIRKQELKIETNEIKLRQNQAAINWLIKQSETKGFSLSTTNDQQVNCAVISYVQQQFIKKSDLKPIIYSSVDYQGVLTVTDAELFLNTIYQGIGKSKGFGCGLFLIKHYQ
ncbi:type I-E CRISPR-associated protein Cas6/Cse3/CasE [Gilliamella apicola]|uniref:Type I-E CRISPR-associated protein Cas6/Cse3/CasE n=1 Tax=Gilliamella apicola TaxID=1196095 RepID=A0A242NHG8_9GAMM|nr:type I-E CRISPR-associated protein Cas6/Cse3/CasE [Gilliamella apicola]OTP82304.1 type I-E CRISPR-associated protein Cas6/Cse3/CasE [Gilliamella apicola]OTP84580.1 type I-E CRISPR-associated protein Cas6/Cse3/CasE [Gilliamella apicola]OTP99508.1 type I-E CRISPR-associated protein Cas6/Cse3/CasE [Gilliamella apicola]OTQ11379.1 type I-E CRISPR-associated protein Cas6/Cse3/CasE [Gilliamella apicola]OTQ16751.1 type I-E CRISPR-associated protein Cas6/Cse3/CasE [Gilliamella apicola]